MKVNYTPHATGARFMQSDALMRVLMGPVGCLPADTEFLTPSGWKRMDAYEPGDLVAGYDNATGEVEFVKPLGYVDKPATDWVTLSRAGFEFVMSDDHKMPVTKLMGGKWRECVLDALEIAQLKSQVKLKSTFSIKGGQPVTPLREAEIKFAVAVNADGYIETDSDAVTFGLVRKPKVDRILDILGVLGYRFTHRKYPTDSGGEYHKIRVIGPAHKGKTFDSPYFWCMTPGELRVVVDELQHWDGHMRGATGYEKTLLMFDTTRESDVGFMQYLGAATGYRTTVEVVPPARPEHKELYRVKFISPQSLEFPVSLRRGGVEAKIAASAAGERKYCFTMPTGFFVIRQNNHVLVSSNSGKSVTCSFEIVRRAAMQEPGPDGIRRSRAAVVRETARQLSDTTIKTFLDWFPDGVCGRFMKTTKTYFFKVGDVECEIMFRALDDADDVANLNSLELTFAWFNECRDIHPDIVDAMSKRIGRYPSAKDGGPTWFGMWGDTNPPTMDTWWYYQMEGLDPVDGVSANDNGWEVFKQPSGRSQFAENIENLPEGYYSTQGRSEEYVRVYIDGEYGLSSAGMPVFKYFRTDYHMARSSLRPIINGTWPVVVGMDLGLTPAAVIGQLCPRGRALIMDELATEDMGAQRFVRTMLKPLLFERFAGAPVLVVVDPAGVQRAQTDERSVVDIIRAEGLRVAPARTNSISARINAVDDYLMRQVDGDPALLVDPRCTRLKSALMGGYRYKKNVPDTIEKNHASHIAEALQYLMLHIANPEGGVVMQRREVRRVAAGGWT